MNQKTLKDTFKNFLFFPIAFLFLISGVSAQSTGRVEISGKVKRDNRPLSACDIKVMQNGSVVQTIQSKENGSFIINLNLQKNYTISFGKEGLVTKTIIFDSKVPQDQSDIIYQNEFNIDLFDDVAGVSGNNSMTKPVAKISFNPAYEDFVHDNNYTKAIQAEQDKVRKDAEALAKQKDMVRQDSLNRIWTDSLQKAHQRNALADAAKAEQERKLHEKEQQRLDSLEQVNSFAKEQAERLQKEKIQKDSLAKAEADKAKLDKLAADKAAADSIALEKTRRDSLAKAEADKAKLDKLATDKAVADSIALKKTRRESLAKAELDAKERQKLSADSDSRAATEARAREKSKNDSTAKADQAMKGRQKIIADSTAKANAEKLRLESLEKANADSEAKLRMKEKQDSIVRVDATLKARQKFVSDSSAKAQAGKAKEDELGRIQAEAARLRLKSQQDSLAKVREEKNRLAMMAKAKEEADTKSKADAERQRQLAMQKAQSDSLALADRQRKEKEESERKAKIQADIIAKKELLAKASQSEDKPSVAPQKRVAIPKIVDSDYKEGVTEETVTETNRSIYRTVVKIGGATNNYQKIVYSWGGVFYFKNQMNMTESTFVQEIKHAKMSTKD